MGSPALVRDAKLDHAVRRRRLESHQARAVAERVVDEVPERLLEAESVAVESHARRVDDLDRSAFRRRRARRTAAQRVVEQLVGRDWLPSQRHPTAVELREDEQVVGEAPQAVDLLGCRAQRLLELLGRARATQGELELGLEQRQGRAELVARVGREAPLALEPVLEPVEHLVECRAEAADLVVRLGQRQPRARLVARDLRRRGGASPRPAEARRRRRDSPPPRRRGARAARRSPARRAIRRAPRSAPRARLRRRGRAVPSSVRTGVSRRRAGSPSNASTRVALDEHRGVRGALELLARTTGSPAPGVEPTIVPSGRRSGRALRRSSGQVAASSGSPSRATSGASAAARPSRLSSSCSRERVAEADVHECADGCENDRHRRGERKGQSDAERQPAHAVSLRRR